MLPSAGAAAGRVQGRAARPRRRRRSGGEGGEGGAATEGSDRASEEGSNMQSEATSAASDRTDATPAGHIRCYAAPARAKHSSSSSTSSATTCNTGSSAFPATPALEDSRNGTRPACYPKTAACELRTGSLFVLARSAAKLQPLASLPGLPRSEARPFTPAPIFAHHSAAPDSGPTTTGVDGSHHADFV